MEEIGLVEALFKKAQTLDNARPAPTGMACCENIDLQRIAGLGAFDRDGTGEGMNARAIYFQVLGQGHTGRNLSAACIDAVDLHFVAGGDMKPRLEGTVPHRVGWVSGEGVLAHDSFTRTDICTSTNALRGSALTPTAARTWRPASPKTCTSRSDAPLITAGESGKPATALT